jgi:hypothetical protein
MIQAFACAFVLIWISAWIDFMARFVNWLSVKKFFPIVAWEAASQKAV